MSGIPVSEGDNKLECSVIKIMKAIGTDVDDCDTEAGHRISKSKGNSKKTVTPFCNRKLSKRALYNKTKLASINTSAVGLGNSTKRFISKNLMDYNYKLVFKCRKIKRGLPSFIVLLQGMALFI